MNEKKSILETTSKKSMLKLERRNEILKSNESIETKNNDVFNSVDLTKSTHSVN